MVISSPDVDQDRALARKQTAAPLAVYITGDGGDVYEDKVFQAAKEKTGSFQPTLLLIGTRLGLDRITPVYWEALKDTLRMPQSVGIAG
jgi:cysteine protease ATG4